MTTIASAEHVQRRYGDMLALSDVCFKLQKGVTGLLGANGAGKTTLISLLLGVLKPDGGKLDVLARINPQPPQPSGALGFWDCRRPG